MSWFYALAWKCAISQIAFFHFLWKFPEPHTDFAMADRNFIGDTRAFYFYNISAEDVMLVSLEADVQITYS